jgi:hypothetical protein
VFDLKYTKKERKRKKEKEDNVEREREREPKERDDDIEDTKERTNFLNKQNKEKATVLLCIGKYCSILKKIKF